MSQKVSHGMHYAMMTALIISNLTVFALAVFFAGPMVGNSLGEIAALQDTVQVPGASAQALNSEYTGLAAVMNPSPISINVISNSAYLSPVSSTPPLFDAMKFSITAWDQHPVAVAKFTFLVTTSTTNSTTNIGVPQYLYVSDSPHTLGSLIAQTTPYWFSPSDIVKSYSDSVPGTVNPTAFEARFDVNNDDPSGHYAEGQTEHLIINAGVTKYFTFLSTVDFGYSSTPVRVFTKLLPDTVPVTGNVLTVDLSPYDNFIWSDLNFEHYASSSATENQGWFNGYKVRGLP